MYQKNVEQVRTSVIFQSPSG